MSELQNSTEQVSQETVSEDEQDADVSIDELKDQETSEVVENSETNDQ